MSTETTEERTTYRPLLDILTEGRTLPDGYDAWGMRAVWPDFTSSHGFRWPFPGNVATAPGPILDHRCSCPNAEGDGICVATTARGMASGGIPANTVLLTAHRAADVVGDSEPEKLRLAEALVVDVVWLKLANLRYANLSVADLSGAHLYGANLSSANLSSANLRGADLSFADLSSADIYGANLRDANLRGADLSGANLSSANLRDANLRGSNLRYANLSVADLSGAHLYGADIYGANGVPA